MKQDQVFPSKYLKAGDLPDEGSQQFTIEKIDIEEIGRDKDKKPIIFFDEIHKGLVCNKTNWKTISRLTGSDDSDDWIGTKINLYRAEVEFQGEMVESIRVKMKADKVETGKPHKPVPITQPSSVDPNDDETPF
jgi:hypothetical protein